MVRHHLGEGLMDHRLLTAAGLAAIVLLMVAGGFLIAGERGQENAAAAPDAACLPGHWVVVNCEGYDDSGSYISYRTGNERALAMDFEVNYVDNEMLYGFFGGAAVSGSYMGGILTMQVTVDGVKHWGTGYLIDEQTLYVSVVKYEQVSATLGHSAGLSMIYSKDPKADTALPVPDVDVTGVWTCVSDVRSTAAGQTVLPAGSTLELTQTCAVFCGVLADPLSGAGSAAGVAGTYSYELKTATEHADYGRIYDTEGTYWMFRVYEGSVSLWSFHAEGGQIVTESRKYVQSGEAAASLPQLMDLAGTQWNCTYYRELNETSAQVYALPCTLKFVSQCSNLVFMSVDIDGTTYQCAAFLGGFDPIWMTACALQEGQNEAVQSFGFFSDERHAEISFYADGQVRYYSWERDDGGPYDALGHWYVAGLYGYDETGTYVDYLPLDQRQVYGLDIVRIEGSTFFGFYRGGGIAGYVRGNSYSFATVIGDSRAQFDCQIQDSQTMTAVMSAHDETDGLGSVWSVLFKRAYTDDGLTPRATNLDYSGTWQMIGGYAFDGTNTAVLTGDRFTVDEIRGNVWKGTMQQVFGSEVRTVGIVGVVRAYTNGTVFSTVVDECGCDATIIITGDQLRYYTTTSSFVDELGAGLITAVRAYSRDGTGIMPTGPGAGIVGESWKQVSCQIMTADGSFSTTVQDTHFTIVGVDGTLYHSTGVYAGRAGSSMGYLNGVYTSFAMRLDGGTVANLGYGYLANGQLTLMTFLRDTTTGYMMTVIATYERV